MPDPFAQTCYRKSFLKDVIARIDFLGPLAGVEAQLPRELSEAAIKAFPIPEPRDARQQGIQFGPDGVKAMPEVLHKEWLFHAKDRSKTLTISPGAVFVENHSYNTYENLIEEFTGVVSKLDAQFANTQCKRVGLRYVNVVELQEANPIEWASYIDPQLLSLFRFPPEQDRAALSRVLNTFEVARDAFSLRCIAGMHNPDYPARIKRKAFVIDLDAYTQSVIPLGEVRGLLDEFHLAIQQYFEKSITQKLRDVMNAG